MYGVPHRLRGGFVAGRSARSGRRGGRRASSRLRASSSVGRKRFPAHHHLNLAASPPVFGLRSAAAAAAAPLFCRSAPVIRTHGRARAHGSLRSTQTLSLPSVPRLLCSLPCSHSLVELFRSRFTALTCSFPREPGGSLSSLSGDGCAGGRHRAFFLSCTYRFSRADHGRCMTSARPNLPERQTAGRRQVFGGVAVPVPDGTGPLDRDRRPASATRHPVPGRSWTFSRGVTHTGTWNAVHRSPSPSPSRLSLFQRRRKPWQLPLPRAVAPFKNPSVRCVRRKGDERSGGSPAAVGDWLRLAIVESTFGLPRVTSLRTARSLEKTDAGNWSVLGFDRSVRQRLRSS